MVAGPAAAPHEHCLWQRPPQLSLAQDWGDAFVQGLL